MSGCGCGCSGGGGRCRCRGKKTESHARVVDASHINNRQRNVVVIDGDYVAGPENDTIITQAPANGDPVVALNVSLNGEPVIGDTVKLVAFGAPITVDGNGNLLAPGAATVATGTARIYTFAGNAFNNDSSLPGTWVATP